MLGFYPVESGDSEVWWGYFLRVLLRMVLCKVTASDEVTAGSLRDRRPASSRMEGMLLLLRGLRIGWG